MDNPNQIKFSILIPAYKSRFLKEAIESVLGQSYKNLELIVVDDCSPEDLNLIVDGFSDSRMSYYRNEKNYGAVNVVDNWNKCLSYASGDYVICMGDDDKLTPTCLADYLKIMKVYPNLDVYHTRTLLINENSEICGCQEIRPEFESAYSLCWHRWHVRLWQYIGDFLFRRQHLLENGGFYMLPLAWGSDDITAVRAAMHKGIANVSNPGFMYRESSLTLSKSPSERLKAEATILEKQWYINHLLGNKPQNNVDSLLLYQLKQSLNIHFRDKFLQYIGYDIQYQPLRFVYWFWNSSRFNILKRHVFLSFMWSLINYFKNVRTR